MNELHLFAVPQALPDEKIYTNENPKNINFTWEIFMGQTPASVTKDKKTYIGLMENPEDDLFVFTDTFGVSDFFYDCYQVEDAMDYLMVRFFSKTIH